MLPPGRMAFFIPGDRMGIYVQFHTISDRNIRKLFEDPSLVEKVVFTDYMEFEDGPDKSGLVLQQGEGETIDIDKAWHGIHYLLTGSASGGAPPLDFILAGGRPIGDADEDMEAMSFRVLTANEVAAVHQALRDVDVDVLRQRFDPAVMNSKDIYPLISMNEGEERFAYCLGYFDTMKAAIADTARRELGLIVAMG
jgi:hypothetical protein